MTSSTASLPAMLAEEGVSAELPDYAATWRAFLAFAERPVAAASPCSIENDMCLFQRGSYDWGQCPRFEWNLTRQFVIHDGDGDYDHMEQLSLTLLFDADDPHLAAIGVGDLWSGSDLANWA